MSQQLDLKSMDMDKLSQLILNDPGMLRDLDESVLCEMANKMNPYAKVVGANSKQVLFSFTNFREDRMSAYKSLSMQRFLSQLISEHEDWTEDLKEELKEEDVQSFKRHLLLFKKHFLDFNKEKHVMSTSHTGNDEMPALDFISKWQRFETLNSKELNEVLDRNLLYKTKQQVALQVYGVYDSVEEARQFIDKNAKTVGFDILMGETNKWIIVQDNEKTLDTIEFVGDQNTLINNLVSQMKEDKQIGEKMLKKRMATKKEENERQNGKDESNVQSMLSTNPSTVSELSMYKQRRLELGDADLLSENVQESYSNIPILNNVNNTLEKKML